MTDSVTQTVIWGEREEKYRFEYTLDWLGDREAFVVYNGGMLDSGFVWMPHGDGTIDVVSLPKTGAAVNQVEGYGQFVTV